MAFAICIKELPNSRVLNAEAPARLANANTAIACNETAALHLLKKVLAFLAIRRLCGETRWQSGKFIRFVFE